MTQQTQARKVNRLTGKPMGVGPFPYSFVVPVIFFSVGIAFLWMLGWISPQLSIFFVFSFMLTFFFLAGKQPWRLYERFHQARKLIRVAPKVDWEHLKGLPMPQKMQRQFTKVKGKRVKTYPVEAEFDLVGYGTTTISNPEIGFYVSHPRRDNETGGRRQFAFTFVWEVWGYDPLLLEEDALAALNAQELAFRRMSRNLIVTFEHESTGDDFEYQSSLDRQLHGATNSLVKMLLYSQKAKVRDLKRRGALQLKRTRILVRYQVASASDRYKISALDHIMGFLGDVGNKLTPLVDQKSGTKNRDKQKQKDLFKLFVHAYKQYRQLHVLWNDTAGLKARTLSLEELWTSDYHQLHNLAAPQLNQVFILSRTSVEVQTRSRHHVLSQLFQPEKGIDPTPKTGNEWIYLPTKRKYASFVQIGKIDAYPEDNGVDRGMIRYLWNPVILAGLKDYKIVTQIKMAFQEGQKFDLGRQVRNSKRLVIDAQRRNTIDVNAEERLEDAVEGLHNLSNGSKIYETATVIWLYRNNPDALKDDFDTLISLIPTPNTELTLYAAEYAWYQSFPFARHRLLTKPNNRLHDYYSHELAGLLPLITPQTLNKEGVLFITREGNVAFLIDLFGLLSHLAIFATTRGGKSVVLGDIIFNAYLRNIPVVAFDYPKETTGASTFTDLTNTLRKVGGGAGYNNIADCFINILQMPDLRHVPEAEDRFAGVIDFQLRALMVLVMGELSKPDSMHEQIFKQSVKTLLSQALKSFHQDPQIKGRYDAAIAAGHGTPEHTKEPTLKDFEPYFAVWFRAYKLENEEILSQSDKEAGAFILGQLRGLLNTRLGESISHPSTFESNVSLLVFALKGISDNYQAAVYALAAYSALLQRALSQPVCLFILDECPILFEFDAISLIVSQLCANGLKWGIRVVLSGQTPGTIYNSAGGDKIRDTVTKVLLGYIVSEAVDSFVDTLKFRRDVISKYGTQVCQPNISELRSYWCFKEGGRHVDLYYQPSDLLLTLLANNTDEQAARDLFYQAYPGNPLKAISEFRQQYIPALTSGNNLFNVKPCCA